MKAGREVEAHQSGSLIVCQRLNHFLSIRVVCLGGSEQNVSNLNVRIRRKPVGFKLQVPQVITPVGYGDGRSRSGIANSSLVPRQANFEEAKDTFGRQ